MISAKKGKKSKVKNLRGSFMGLVKFFGLMKTSDKLLIFTGILIYGQS